MKISLFKYHEIYPLKALGLTGSFWTIHIDTLIFTWVGMFLLLALALVGRHALKRETSLTSLAFEKGIGFFIDLCNDSFITFQYHYFAFVTSLFFFALFGCLVGLIPFLDEAAKDLNTTLAIGLTSFLYVQYQKIRVRGVFGYCAEFAEPFFPFAPINIVGELAKIASMSFRLFGNILGGSIILTMLIQLISSYQKYFLLYAFSVLLAALLINKVTYLKQYQGLSKFVNGAVFALFLLTWAQIVFGIFEVFIQAFVLTMLTTTYLAMGAMPTTPEQETEEVA